MANDQNYVDLGVACADVCEALNRGLGGRQPGDLSKSLLGAIEQLTAWVKPAMRLPSGSLTKISIAGL